MAALTIRTPSEGDSTDLTFESAASGGDTYKWSRNTVLLVNNGSGGSITVTINAGTSSYEVPGVGNLSKSNISGSVANSAIALIDTRSEAFRGSSGNVSVSYSDNTSVTVSAVKLEQV